MGKGGNQLFPHKCYDAGILACDRKGWTLTSLKITNPTSERGPTLADWFFAARFRVARSEHGCEGRAAPRESVIAEAIDSLSGDPDALAYRWTVVLAVG